MIIVDTALKAREEAGNPIRVGMVGAGFMGRGIASQILNYTPGMNLVAIASRTEASARNAYEASGVGTSVSVNTLTELEAKIQRGTYVTTDDATLLCRADNIDILLEVTGTIDFAARVVLSAIQNEKPVVLMNAELEGTLGPILKHYADKKGIILSGCDGDQPGVQMNLYRHVKSIGLRPLVCGNIKGLQDPYRNPTTQAGFAARWGQSPSMVTSFADGTKISFEQATVANATGMGVPKRGMLGMEFQGHIDELTQVYDLAQLKAWGGIVDYVIGAKPAPGVYVIGLHEDSHHQHYLNYYKKGNGPLYSFYTPYHLCHLEVPLSLARVFLFRDSVVAPRSGPVVDVITIAKQDIQCGEIIDGIGEYMTYGTCENSDITAQQQFLPMGLAKGCRAQRKISKDEPLRYSDVERPSESLAFQLRTEQDMLFSQI